MILGKLDELGLAEDTIVVWTSDNSSDPSFRMPAIDPDPAGGQWKGFSGPWRGGYFTSLEGFNRAPCIIRWPGNVPKGKVSNEFVHLVDMFTTLVLAAGAKVPADRQINGMDMRAFCWANGEESYAYRATACRRSSGANGSCTSSNRMSSSRSGPHTTCRTSTTWNGIPAKKTKSVFPTFGWQHPMAAAAGAFLKTLAIEPPIKPGTPDPYLPPNSSEVRVEEHLQIGVITQYVSSLTRTHKELPEPEHGVCIQMG